MNDDRLLNLRYWLELLSHHRWVIVGCVGGVAAIAAFFSLQLTPMYQSESTLYFAAPQVKTLAFQDIFTQQRMRPQEQILTYTQIIGSTPVLERAVRDLEARGLLDFDQPEPPPEATWASRIIDLLPWQEEEPEPAEVTADVRRDRYVRRLKRRLEFETIGTGDSFLKVGVIDETPGGAAALANAVTTAYVESSRDMLRKGADEAVAWLERKLEEQQTRLVKAEENLRKNSSAGSVNVDDASQLVIRELTLLQEGLMDIRLRIMAEESRQAVVSTDPLDGADQQTPAPAFDVNADVAAALRARVRADLINTSVELDQLKQRLGDRHPDVILAMDKKKRLEEQLASMPPPSVLDPATLNPADPNARVPVEMLRAQEKLLSENLDRALKTISAEGAKGTKAEIYRREVEIQRNLYGQMLNRKNEIILSAKLDAADTEVFEKAAPRPFPVSPNHARTIVLALFGGLVLGLGIAVVRDHLDQSVRDPDQAFDLMKAPVLGMIPFDSRMKRIKPNGPQSILSGHGEDDSQTEEAYQVLRSHIEGAQPNGAAQILLVTSAVPGEGKSTTAAHLAAAFADAGDRILLVDGDFRRPSLSRYFNIDLQNDLSDVLLGKVPPEQAVYRDESSILDIIATRPGGEIPQGARL
ncbi:MAG TPA: GNVR domain-containing protein, partial [Candidatus Polarisedimenticolia bacterium]|nr:GNVR domain-containing protein [Candidatus Polarisedimenticolia bacterium]